MHKLVIAATAVLLASVVAQSAAAAPPLIEELPPFELSTVMTGVCPFPVTVDSTLTGSQITFFDQAGNVTRVEITTHEQDNFSANGKTLVGSPFSFKLMLILDPASGEILHAYARGRAATVRLPDGSLFLTAGRLDFVNHPDELFVLQPDVGAQGDIAAFCAALSP
jgi:hypothetical protein